MKNKNKIDDKDLKVTKQEIDKWSKKLTVKSKNVLKIFLISGISLIVIGGGIGAYYAYNTIKLREEAKNKCTVTFDTNGGSIINPAQISKGKQLQKPDNPIKEGYSLMSWCEDAELNKPVKFPLTINNSMTLYAKWSVAVFNVDFYKDTSDITPYKTQTITYNKTVETPPEDPIKTGYKFAGWFTNKQKRELNNRFFYGSGELGTPITKNLSVYADWVEENDTDRVVTYDFGKNQRYQYRAVKDELAPQKDYYIKNPTYPGYNFSGWITDLSNPTSTWDLNTKKVDEDVTLYAKWNKEGFATVTFSYGDGKSFDTQSVEIGKSIKKPDNPTYAGYEFDNWYENKGCTGNPFSFSTPINNDKVLYAKWTRCEWNVTEDEYKDSFKYLVDIEGVTPVEQNYIADGFCRRTIKKDKEEEVDFNVSKLEVKGDLEKCLANGGGNKPYVYTKKQNNFYIYARADSDNLGAFSGVKETNIRGQLGEVFASIYDAYPYLNINHELKSFIYKFKDEEYDINTNIKFVDKKIKKLYCDYSHTENGITTIYNIDFEYGYVEPSITFPNDDNYKNEEKTHIHEFNDQRCTENQPILANTIGDHILNVPYNIVQGGEQYFYCYTKDESGNQQYVDFITEDVTFYRNDKLLEKDIDYKFDTKENVKVLYLTVPAIVIPEPDTFSLLLHQTKSVSKDINIIFKK